MRFGATRCSEAYASCMRLCETKSGNSIGVEHFARLNSRDDRYLERKFQQGTGLLDATKVTISPSPFLGHAISLKLAIRSRSKICLL